MICKRSANVNLGNLDRATHGNHCFLLACSKDKVVTTTTLSDEALPPAFAAARSICRRHARDSYYASFFLPAAKRQAAHAAYAFCRMIREAFAVPADQLPRGASALREHPAVASPRALPVIRPQHADDPSQCEITSFDSRMTMLRERLDEIYTHRLELPSPAARSKQQHALYAFAATIRNYEIPQQYFLDLADACRVDLTKRRYETWDELKSYCSRSMGKIAVIMSCIFGVTNSGAFAQVRQLGTAMQLTEILRDVNEDLSHDRVYLPLEDLCRFGYSEYDLSRRIDNDQFRSLMKFQVQRARELYRAGADGICWLADDGSRLAASLVTVLHAGILKLIERRPFDVFSNHMRLSPAQKLRRLPSAWRLARREHEQPLPQIC